MAKLEMNLRQKLLAKWNELQDQGFTGDSLVATFGLIVHGWGMDFAKAIYADKNGEESRQ